MSDAIGALRARVRLESLMRVTDEIGGAALAWLSQGEAWAEIAAGGVASNAGLDTSTSVASYRISIRRRDDVRAGWRVVWGARSLSVLGVRDEGGARIELICEEEVL